MDFGNAIVLTGAIFGVAELLKSLLPESWLRFKQVVVFIVLVASFGMVFLVGATVWAHTQVIGNLAMDQMSTADKVFISLILAGGAGVFKQGFTAVKNVGQNQVDTIDTSTSPGPTPQGTGR